MPDELAKRAAAHSTEAHALLEAARDLRLTARRFDVAAVKGVRRAEKLADEVRRLADRADQLRREVMAE